MMCLSVRHRIDGLETNRVIPHCMPTVRHRIDGLETIDSIIKITSVVRHRIDGLEISIKQYKML